MSYQHELTNKLVIVKKTRKKNIIPCTERCKAIINNGKQCSRRKKYNDFCGKHKLKQHFGVINTYSNISNLITDNPKENNKNFLEVKQFKYNDTEYLIDNNKIIFNREGTEIIGKLNENNEIYII